MFDIAYRVCFHIIKEYTNKINVWLVNFYIRIVSNLISKKKKRKVIAYALTIVSKINSLNVYVILVYNSTAFF